MKPRVTGAVYQQKRNGKLLSPNWYLTYYENGKRLRECSGTPDRKAAEDLLRSRMAEIGRGLPIGLEVKKLTVEKMASDLFAHYENKKRRSLTDVQARWEIHLKPMFGHLRALQVTTDRINRYIQQRRDEGAAPATINRELSVLRKMFFLAHKSKKLLVDHIPHFELLEEDNERDVFIETHEQYLKMAEESTKIGLWLRAMFECAYTYGWRVSELIGNKRRGIEPMKVRQVDFVNRVIQLKTSKNGEGREVAMMPHDPVFALLRECCLGKSPDDYVFTRMTEHGHKPVSDFRESWKKCCAAAGMPDLRFHDLRRTAAVNMLLADVPAKWAMSVTGHKTQQMFDRYARIRRNQMHRVAEKMGQFRKEQQAMMEAHHDLLRSEGHGHNPDIKTETGTSVRKERGLATQ